ncbi:MAG TPA: hypothetical protein VF676_07640 [Flavobacterium sp.]|jgi:hypothetical protein
MSLRSSWWIVLSLVLSSCGGKSFESADELKSFINDEDNGYKYIAVVNGVEYSLLYKPTDLLVLQDVGTERVDNEKVRLLRQKYGRYMYFTLSMSINDTELLSQVAQDKSKFGRMLNDLAFQMDQKVHLYTKFKDTVPMTDFIYPRMFGASKSTNILIVYPRKSDILREDYLNFSIEDLGFNTGEVKFKVRNEAVLNEPQIRFN